MAPRLSKRDGELIDQIFAENPAADANQVADLFHTTYKTVSERRRKLFNRIRTGVDLRKRPGPKKASHRARREDAVMSTPPSFPSSSLHASLQQPQPQLQLQLQPIMSTLPPPRRIVTSNLPLPRRYAGVKDAEPAVQVVSEDIEPVPELNGGDARGTVFTHDVVPTSNAGLDITPQEIAGGGIVIPRGANIRFNDIGPGERVPMHRTSTTDYDIFIIGSVVLLTPDEAYDPQSGKGKLLETICKPGDVVVQRGALHAWENRSTEWVRFLSILLGAEPTSVEVEGEFDGRGPVTKELADCFDV